MAKVELLDQTFLMLVNFFNQNELVDSSGGIVRPVLIVTRTNMYLPHTQCMQQSPSPSSMMSVQATDSASV